MNHVLFFKDANFETYRVARSNCEAAWAAKEFAANPYRFGTLYIYGDAGNGRTHLTTAIESEWEKKRYEFRELMGNVLIFELQLDELYKKDFTVENFVNEYVHAKALLVEDVENFEGKEEQEYLGALLKSFLDQGKPIFMTGTKKPNTFEGWNEWIRACVSGHAVEIHEPELDLKMRVLHEYMERWNYNFSYETLEAVARKENSIDGVLGIWRSALSRCAYGREPLTEEILLKTERFLPIPKEEILEARQGLLDLLDSWIEELDKEVEENE